MHSCNFAHPLLFFIVRKEAVVWEYDITELWTSPLDLLLGEQLNYSTHPNVFFVKNNIRKPRPVLHVSSYLVNNFLCPHYRKTIVLRHASVVLKSLAVF